MCIIISVLINLYCWVFVFLSTQLRDAQKEMEDVKLKLQKWEEEIKKRELRMKKDNKIVKEAKKKLAQMTKSELQRKVASYTRYCTILNFVSSRLLMIESIYGLFVLT